ncbi:MAG: hypothetical protein ACE5J5_01635 [Candidatus Hydrothermarchaeales archaeon]
MHKVFLDTNVYYIGLTYINTNSNIILKNIDKFTPVTSPYLVEEVKILFKRKRGKDWIGRVHDYTSNLQSIHVMEEEITPILGKYHKYVTDKKDLPHICTYFASDSDYFVTTNRRLTQMKVKGIVKFMNPKRFVKDVLKIKPIDSIDGI